MWQKVKYLPLPLHTPLTERWDSGEKFCQSSLTRFFPCPWLAYPSLPTSTSLLKSTLETKIDLELSDIPRLVFFHVRKSSSLFVVRGGSWQGWNREPIHLPNEIGVMQRKIKAGSEHIKPRFHKKCSLNHDFIFYMFARYKIWKLWLYVISKIKLI